MQYIDNLQNQQGGFNFDLSIRNELLAQKTQTQHQQVTFKKTGTTIVGLVYKDGVILAADTRATAGTVVADKNCEKIDFIAPNMYCCGAGTAADTQYVKYLMKSQMELMRLNTNRQSRVSTCVTRLQQLLFQHQGHIGAHLILGGYDIKGPQLCMLSNNGYISYLPYATMGSGSLAAVSILESKYKDNMELEEARQLCIEAIEAGIFHDLGSGSNVDLCIISKEKSEMQRNIKMFFILILVDNQKCLKNKYHMIFLLKIHLILVKNMFKQMKLLKKWKLYHEYIIINNKFMYFQQYIYINKWKL